MNKELEKYYENRFDMMASQGWKDLMEDTQRIIDSANTLDGVDDEKKLQFRRGEVSILKWLLSLKEVSEETFNKLKEE